MNTLLIRNVRCDGRRTDILIEGNRIARIAPGIVVEGACRVIDGSGKAAVPPFYNTHTHAAMTLLRGYADDMELFTWLNDRIWPAEGTLTGEDVYAGTRLALLEMIRSGTVFFNDMYWHQPATLRAVEEMGLRAAIGLLYISGSDGALLERNARSNAELLACCGASGRIQLAHAPHAVYSVSEEVLRRVAEAAESDGRMIHIHASETAREVEECVKAHGMTPVAYLDSLGLLGPRTVLAHAVHLSEADIAIIRERRACVAHCPCSNFKLASGRFRYRSAVETADCRFTIGTDGCASNNNLSMLEEMKFAALSAKSESGTPTAGRDEDIFRAATRAGAEAFGLDAGVVKEGKLADVVLVDLDNPLLVPDYSLTANLVYSADSSCIDTVICDGRVLMENRRIPGEAEILAEARRVCARLRALREGRQRA